MFQITEGDFRYRISISLTQRELFMDTLMGILLPDLDGLPRPEILAPGISWLFKEIYSATNEKELSIHLFIKDFDALNLIYKSLCEEYDKFDRGPRGVLQHGVRRGRPLSPLGILVTYLKNQLKNTFCNCDVPYHREFEGMVWCEGCHNRFSTLKGVA